MKITLATLSNHLYSESRLNLARTALSFGIVDVRSYTFEDITKSGFYKQNIEILGHLKTMGYWLWKPYIINEVLNTLSYGDIVIYIDAGIEIIADLKPLVDLCNIQSDIMVFANSNYTNEIWTKRDCFVLMDCDSSTYWNGQHIDAACCIFKKTDRSVPFVQEWLAYGCNPKIITGDPNVCGLPNLPKFIEHRYDQSILSLLAIKYGAKPYRMPTQFGNHYKMKTLRVKGEFNCINQGDPKQLDNYSSEPMTNSPYPQLLDHHRRQNGMVKLNAKRKSQKGNPMISLLKRIKRKFLGASAQHTNSSIPFRGYSFSQCGEDRIVQYVFSLRNLQKPSYLDIGANDPFFLSNTALFYQNGCRGINVEANPLLINAFNVHRPGDTNLNIGVNDRPANLDFYVMQDNTLSTFSKEESEKMVAAGKPLDSVKKVPLTTINDILQQYCNGVFPDFLSLDVEGFDFQILQSIDFAKSAPKIICVEAAEYSPIGTGARRNELIDFLVTKGYYEYANTNLNAIMVKRSFWFINE